MNLKLELLRYFCAVFCKLNLLFMLEAKIMKNYTKISGKYCLCLIATSALLSSSAFAQRRFTASYSLANNIGFNNKILDEDISNTGDATHSSADISFTGMNRNGFQQTMRFVGETSNSAEYGRLRCFSSGTVTNLFNNPLNPIYYNSNTDVTNPNGVPDTFSSLGFSYFEDVLQFGGVLGDGYRARYIFRVDGTNSGNGALANLVTSIANNPDEVFFAANTGFTSENWVTQTYAINGITPQSIRVQFSNQVVVDTFEYPDGSTITGRSDFSSTLTLARIEVVNANNELQTGWTVSSASGTNYPVPEPATMSVLTLGMLGILSKRKKTKIS